MFGDFFNLFKLGEILMSQLKTPVLKNNFLITCKVIVKSSSRCAYFLLTLNCRNFHSQLFDSSASGSF